MKFVKPSGWITPDRNRNGIGDVCPALAHIGTFFQVVTYPLAAVVSGIGAIATKNK